MGRWWKREGCSPMDGGRLRKREEAEREGRKGSESVDRDEDERREKRSWKEEVGREKRNEEGRLEVETRG